MSKLLARCGIALFLIVPAALTPCLSAAVGVRMSGPPPATAQGVDPLVEEGVQIRLDKLELDYVRRIEQLGGPSWQARNQAIWQRGYALGQKVGRLSRDAQLAVAQQTNNRYALVFPPLRDKWAAEERRLNAEANAVSARRATELGADVLVAAERQADRILRQRQLQQSAISPEDAQAKDAADVAQIAALQDKYAGYGADWAAAFNRQMQDQTNQLVQVRDLAQRTSDTTSEIGSDAKRATELTLAQKRNAMRRGAGAISYAEESQENVPLTAELRDIEAKYATGGPLASSARDFEERVSNAVLLGQRQNIRQWELEGRAEYAAKNRPQAPTQQFAMPTAASYPAQSPGMLGASANKKSEIFTQLGTLGAALVIIGLLAFKTWRRRKGRSSLTAATHKNWEAMESYEDRRFTIDLYGLTGAVLGTEKRSETHISGGGGGGYSYQGTGQSYTSPIHSTVVTKHEFWLRLADGTEKALQLEGHDIPLLVGQRVTIIGAQLRGGDSIYHSILLNHNERSHRSLYGGANLYTAFGMKRHSLILGFLLAVVGFFAFQAAPVKPETAAMIIIAVSLAAVIVSLRKNNTGFEALDAHLERLAQQTYSRVAIPAGQTTPAAVTSEPLARDRL